MPDQTLPQPLYVSIAEAAQLLGVHRTALYYAIAVGHLTPVRVMGKQALLRTDVLQYHPKPDPRRH